MTDEYWKPRLIDNEPLEAKIWKIRKYAQRPGQMICTRCPAYTLSGPERFLGYGHRFVSVGHGSTLGRNFIPNELGRIRSCYYGHKNHIAMIKNDYAESSRNYAAVKDSLLDLRINESKTGRTGVRNPLAPHVTNGITINSSERHLKENIGETHNITTTYNRSNGTFNKWDTSNDYQGKNMKSVLCTKEGSMEMKDFFDEVKQIQEKYRQDWRCHKARCFQPARKQRHSRNFVIVKNDRTSFPIDEKTLESLIDPADWLWTPSSWRITRPTSLGSSTEISVDDMWIDDEKEMQIKELKLCFEDAD